MTTNTTGRYNIGEEIYTCAFIYNNRSSATQPLVYNNDLPKEVMFKKLTVKEHHRVPEVNGNHDEKTADGYILTDDAGNRYTNQYPKAFYGQLSDHCDRVFTIECGGISQQEIKKTFDNSHEKPYEFVAINEIYIPIFNYLIRDNSNIPANRVEQVTSVKNMIDDQFEIAYPGKELEVVPIVWKNNDGTECCVPHIVEVKVFDKQVTTNE